MYRIDAPLLQHCDNVNLGAMDLNASAGKALFAVGVGLPALLLGGVIGVGIMLVVCEKAVRTRDAQWRAR